MTVRTNITRVNEYSGSSIKELDRSYDGTVRDGTVPIVDSGGAICGVARYRQTPQARRLNAREIPSSEYR